MPLTTKYWRVAAIALTLFCGVALLGDRYYRGQHLDRIATEACVHIDDYLTCFYRVRDSVAVGILTPEEALGVEFEAQPEFAEAAGGPLAVSRRL